MKKFKKYIIILILAILSVLMLATNLYATSQCKKGCTFDWYDYGDTNPTIDIIGELLNDYGNGNGLIGKTIHLGATPLQKSTKLYCIEHSQQIGEAHYKIASYVSIEGRKAVDAYGNEYISDSNATMASILAGNLDKGYGYIQNKVPYYTEAQQALYVFWYEWALEAQNGGLNITDAVINDDQYGSTGKGGNENESAALGHLANAKKDWEDNGTIFKVEICCLVDTSGSKQDLLLVRPHDPVEPSELTIEKVDADSGENLKGVEFVVKNNDTGLYISEAEDKGNNIFNVTGYAKLEADALRFTTGTNSYQKIVLKQLSKGTYQVKETANPNDGYVTADHTENINKTWNITLGEGASKTEKLTNKKASEETRLVIQKLDKDTRERLGGVEFKIQNADTGEYVSSVNHKGNNVYEVTGYSTSIGSAITLTTGTTSEYKDITINKLKAGKYNIIETRNPNTGYNPYPNLTEQVHIVENMNHIKTIENELIPTDTQLIINKVDYYDNTKKLAKVSFVFYNVDEGKYISAATETDVGSNIFTVADNAYTSGGEGAKVFWTGQDGNYKEIVIKGLKPGKYKIEEKENNNAGYSSNKGTIFEKDIYDKEIVVQENTTNRYTLENKSSSGGGGRWWRRWNNTKRGRL